MNASHFEFVSRSFTVADIADPVLIRSHPKEPLASIAEQFKLANDPQECLIAIIREGSKIHGYLDRWMGFHDAKGVASDMAIPIHPDAIVSSSMPLADLIPLLETRPYYFVLTRNDITHTVTFFDIDKPAMMVCMFSLVAQLEAGIIRYLARDGKAIDSHLRRLSDGRLNKAEELFKAKCPDRKPTPHSLLMCTTLIDRLRMIGFDKNFRERVQFENEKTQGHLFKQIENVRNAIAHCGSLVVVFGNPQSLNLFMGKVKSMITIINSLNEEVACP